MLDVREPSARVESLRITALSFSDVELTADIAIDNPNAIGVSLSSFSYDVLVEGNRLVSGREDTGLSIAAQASSNVTLPVVLSYEEIRRVVQASRQQDELAYAVSIDLSFELPVLGTVTLPVERDGLLPVVRLPRVAVTSLALESIGLTGAELVLGVQVDNPNGFAFDLSALDYQLTVQDQVWVAGEVDRGRTLTPRGTEEFNLAFSLSFSALGRAVRDVLLGDDEIRYEFDGAIAVAPELPLLGPTTIPLNLSGALPLQR
ncbi:MAG: LEA type 2 family protein [Spirochaetales bacterium]